MIVNSSPRADVEDALLALADQADGLHGPELKRRVGILADLTAPGAGQALADLVEAVGVLADMGGCPPNADLHSDEPAGAVAEWERHRDDALHRLLNPTGGQS